MFGSRNVGCLQHPGYNSLGTVSSVVGIASGVSGLLGGDDSGQSNQQAAQAADPFAPYRAQYIGQLNTLMSNPWEVTKQPGYEWLRSQGEQGVIRTLAAQGRTQSGAEQIELAKYDQGFANTFYNDSLNRLMQLSGASQNPAAGQAAYAANDATNYNRSNNGYKSIMQGLGGLNSIYGDGPQQAPAPVTTSTPRPVDPSGWFD